MKNGFKPHHVADAYLAGLFYTIASVFPGVGWVAGAIYYISNEVYKHYNDGKSY